MSEKDISAILGVVINALRNRFTYEEVALKIVNVSVRGAKSAINIVYSGKAPKAIVAAETAIALLKALKNRPRLRKFTYFLIRISKHGSVRASKFKVNLRIPLKVFLILISIVNTLINRNFIVRRWNVKQSKNSYRIAIVTSYPLPELDLNQIKESIRDILSKIQDITIHVELDIKTTRGVKKISISSRES